MTISNIFSEAHKIDDYLLECISCDNIEKYYESKENKLIFTFLYKTGYHTVLKIELKNCNNHYMRIVFNGENTFGEIFDTEPLQMISKLSPKDLLKCLKFGWNEMYLALGWIND